MGRRAESGNNYHDDIIAHLYLCCKVDHAIAALGVPVFPQKCPVSRGITTEHLTSSARGQVVHHEFSIKRFKEHNSVSTKEHLKQLTDMFSVPPDRTVVSSDVSVRTHQTSGRRWVVFLISSALGSLPH